MLPVIPHKSYALSGLKWLYQSCTGPVALPCGLLTCPPQPRGPPRLTAFFLRGCVSRAIDS